MKKLFALLLSAMLILAQPLSVLAAPITLPDGSVFDPEFYAQQNPDVVAVLGTDRRREDCRMRAMYRRRRFWLRWPSERLMSSLRIGIETAVYGFLRIPDIIRILSITGNTMNMLNTECIHADIRR